MEGVGLEWYSSSSSPPSSRDGIKHRFCGDRFGVLVRFVGGLCPLGTCDIFWLRRGLLVLMEVIVLSVLDCRDSCGAFRALRCLAADDAEAVCRLSREFATSLLEACCSLGDATIISSSMVRLSGTLSLGTVYFLKNSVICRTGIAVVTDVVETQDESACERRELLSRASQSALVHET